jgi:competence protein ComFC
MKNFLTNLLDWIYKKKCYFCGSSKECVKMCSGCFDEMQYLPAEPNRKILGINVYCAGIYEENLQKLIRGLKYHNQKDLAYFQAKFMFDYWQKVSNKSESYQIAPVPLFKTREKNRKYNHMALVADEFSKLSGYEVNLNLLKRVKETKLQYKLTKAQRMENLEHAFEVNPKAMKNGKVFLIDDICTTGSTFESIILELQRAGISDIVCFATTTPVEA